MPSSVRAWRRSGAVVPRPPVEAPIASRRGRQVGQQADDLGRGRAEQVGQDRVGQRPEGRTDGPHDRAVRLVDTGGPGRSPEHGHRLAQGADPGDRLVEQAADPDPGRAVDQDGPRPTMRGVVEGRREIGERVFAPHEPGARIPDRHVRHHTGRVG